MLIWSHLRLCGKRVAFFALKFVGSDLHLNDICMSRTRFK